MKEIIVLTPIRKMNKNDCLHITETPRDAMQGFRTIIPAGKKAEYINLLLKCGYETVDIGSFVSPKAVPQMADTSEVISLLDTERTKSKIMVLAGNSRGGSQAAAEHKVQIISFPYSVSGTFLKRNLNTTPEAAWQTVLELFTICDQSQKELRVYVTMAFGNPYGDKWNDEIVIREVEKLYSAGIRNIVFSDVTGEGTPGNIERLSSLLITSFPGVTMGVHLHTRIHDWQPKVEAAWSGGMRNFESALGGLGGCPMTGYELLGNLDTLNLLQWCKKQGIETGIKNEILDEARSLAVEIFQ